MIHVEPCTQQTEGSLEHGNSSKMDLPTQHFVEDNPFDTYDYGYNLNQGDQANNTDGCIYLSMRDRDKTTLTGVEVVAGDGDVEKYE